MFKHEYNESISDADLPCGKETEAERKAYRVPEKIDCLILVALQELFVPLCKCVFTPLTLGDRLPLHISSPLL